jgi:hypothetical protein
MMTFRRPVRSATVASSAGSIDRHPDVGRHRRGNTGVMLLHDGRILGGDALFYYLGAYS